MDESSTGVKSEVLSAGDRVSKGKTKVCWCYCGGVCVMLVLCRLVMVPV